MNVYGSEDPSRVDFVTGYVVGEIFQILALKEFIGLTPETARRLRDHLDEFLAAFEG